MIDSQKMSNQVPVDSSLGPGSTNTQCGNFEHFKTFLCQKMMKIWPEKYDSSLDLGSTNSQLVNFEPFETFWDQKIKKDGLKKLKFG